MIARMSKSDPTSYHDEDAVGSDRCSLFDPGAEDAAAAGAFGSLWASIVTEAVTLLLVAEWTGDAGRTAEQHAPMMDAAAEAAGSWGRGAYPEASVDLEYYGLLEPWEAVVYAREAALGQMYAD